MNMAGRSVGQSSVGHAAPSLHFWSFNSLSPTTCSASIECTTFLRDIQMFANVHHSIFLCNHVFYYSSLFATQVVLRRHFNGIVQLLYLSKCCAISYTRSNYCVLNFVFKSLLLSEKILGGGGHNCFIILNKNLHLQVLTKSSLSLKCILISFRQFLRFCLIPRYSSSASVI